MSNPFFSRNTLRRAWARIRLVDSGSWAVVGILSVISIAGWLAIRASDHEPLPRVRVVTETFGDQKVTAIDLDTWGSQLATSLNRADDLAGQVQVLASEACLISQTATTGDSDVVNAAELLYPAIERLVGQIQGGSPRRVSVHLLLEEELAKRGCAQPYS